MPTHFILQIETATQVCSVALSRDGTTIAFRDIDEPNVHASQLTLLVEALLREAGLTFADLSAIAVSKGPGSYTGLRIGVSAAKGLCYATDLPLIGVDTLAGMAAGFAAKHAEEIEPKAWLCPMVDARRMEVYTGMYDHRLKPLKSAAAIIIDTHSFSELPVGQRVLLFGNGADKFQELFAANERVAVIPHFRNSARYLSGCAYQALLDKQFEDVAYFEPYYLKDFVATTPKQR
ncbi:tRNA (adenosine(37)-N6)-threonylcarbamoyltransferase complex dimerization subunit type 1 TsaB [Parapedobacter sp. ISTM3]|uniref:tRNA threonylcarbamoyladenosine biosynthesis protein TsaB n=1 Tax=Parapedobacter luteus TaxID=623280 RepID=A0A1T5E213_9SPHI|nr:MULTISPECIES: tRNA (adenosine(37)-N6)-threonylcarbamoyltransferase complex dimerization subunit type 1 TsaB [Parapedobacter]MBK1441018.1 tRNA (adenosine(37)-N6)-threonylcarbamoyltransferase complex dimerization subunit type 1 TsaB [Parapedobacter sp. ISTM3]SKB77810.1 tRNA threonylcarbamoyladenosine biosynthesis protein TsaB [Parapedobacter luteus]